MFLLLIIQLICNNTFLIILQAIQKKKHTVAYFANEQSIRIKNI